MKYTILLFFLLFTPWFSCFAQSNLSLGENSLSITAEPNFPGPDTPITLTANDYSLPIKTVGFRWFVDGKLLTDAVNERSIQLTSKALGENTNVKLVASLVGGGSVTATRILKPIYLDIIVEPQTRVPAFYAGRALPSIGSTVNATALINGNGISPQNLVYVWRVNRTVLQGGSIRGKNTTSFTMPSGRFATLGVEVYTVSGDKIAERLINVQNIDPKLFFYETNDLYGLAEKAIMEPITLIGDSVTVRAEPYYLDLKTFNNPDFYEWKIANYIVTNNQNNPYEVTLASQGGSGTTAVKFHVRNTVQLLQGAEDSFMISY